MGSEGRKCQDEPGGTEGGETIIQTYGMRETGRKMIGIPEMYVGSLLATRLPFLQTLILQNQTYQLKHLYLLIICKTIKKKMQIKLGSKATSSIIIYILFNYFP